MLGRFLTATAAACTATLSSAQNSIYPVFAGHPVTVPFNLTGGPINCTFYQTECSTAPMQAVTMLGGGGAYFEGVTTTQGESTPYTFGKYPGSPKVGDVTFSFQGPGEFYQQECASSVIVSCNGGENHDEPPLIPMSAAPAYLATPSLAFSVDLTGGPVSCQLIGSGSEEYVWPGNATLVTSNYEPAPGAQTDGTLTPPSEGVLDMLFEDARGAAAPGPAIVAITDDGPAAMYRNPVTTLFVMCGKASSKAVSSESDLEL